jgi:hypothetical protein
MMATRGPRFSAIPGIPQSGLTDWQFGTLNAMKENLELLMGARGSDSTVQAVLRGQVTVENPANPTMVRVSASGTGYTIGNVTVPSLDDYSRLVSDVQQLANDVAALRATVNTLINQLKG